MGTDPESPQTRVGQVCRGGRQQIRSGDPGVVVVVMVGWRGRRRRVGGVVLQEGGPESGVSGVQARESRERAEVGAEGRMQSVSHPRPRPGPRPRPQASQRRESRLEPRVRQLAPVTEVRGAQA